jgi:hypothetical protein
MQSSPRYALLTVEDTRSCLYAPKLHLDLSSLASHALCISFMLSLKHRWTRCQNHHKTSDYKTPCNHTDNDDTPPAGRKLSANNVVLCLEISVEPNEQHQDRYSDERCPKRLAQVPQLVEVMRMRVDRDV